MKEGTPTINPLEIKKIWEPKAQGPKKGSLSTQTFGATISTSVSQNINEYVNLYVKYPSW